MNNILTRLAIVMATALFFTTTLNAQTWTLAGPDDGNQPGPHTYYPDDARAMVSDRGDGFYLAFREYFWLSSGFSDGRVTVRHWNGSNWQTIGNRGFSDGDIRYTDIAAAPDQSPYVVYQDHSAGRKAVVKMFNGSSWVSLGTAVSSGVAMHPRIAIDASGTPYVAYVDSPAARKVTVKKWNGAAWQEIGASNFTPANVQHLRLAVGSSGLPQVFVYYAVLTSGRSAEVFRYNGSAWTSIGDPAINTYGDGDLALSGDTTYVAYLHTWGDSINVSKYNGTGWVRVGRANFVPAAINLQLTINASKGIFVSAQAGMRDYTSDKAPIVRHFDGANWAIVGPDTFVNRRRAIIPPILGVDTAGTPHVLIYDYKNRFLKLTGGAWIPQGGTEGITNGPSTSAQLASAPDGKNAFAIGGGDAYFNGFQTSIIYRYDTGWTEIGKTGTGGLKGYAVDIAVHPDGEPWLVIKDSGSYTLYSIWKHTPSGWVYTGLRDTAESITLTFDESGNAFVALTPHPAGGVQVHKYTAASGWGQLPRMGPANSGYKFAQVRTDPAGVPYILAGGHVSTHPYYLYVFEVYKFNGTAWQPVGGTFNSAYNTYFAGNPDLAIDSSGVPYVVFPNTSQYAAKVQKFDATAGWVDVVSPGAEPLHIQNPHIAFAPDGSLYLSYADGSINPQRVGTTVKRLSGNTWQTVGVPAFTKTTVLDPNLAFLNNRLLVTFSDAAMYAYKYQCNAPATISVQPRDTAVCSGSPARFTVAATGATAYRWQYNNGNGWHNVPAGGIYSGVTDDTLMLSSTLRSHDRTRFRCVISNTCDLTNISEIAVLGVDTNAWPPPAISITADKSSACSGIPVTFKAATVNAGVMPEFEWSINGSPVAGGTDSIFTTTALATGDAVTCRLTRISACGALPVSSASSPLVVDINPIAAPSVSITASPGTGIYIGQPVTFTANVTNGGPAPQYQWLVNGAPVSAATSSAFTTTTLTDGNTVSVRVKRNDTCALPNTVLSNVLSIQTWPAGVNSIQNAHNIFIYPQPARDHIRISGLEAVPAGVHSLRLYDVMGRIVHEEQLVIDGYTSTYYSALSTAIPAGTYRLLLHGTGKVAEATIIIAR